MAKQYDLFCNGYEAGGGSIRNYRREVQEKILELMGHDQSKLLFGRFGADDPLYSVLGVARG